MSWRSLCFCAALIVLLYGAASVVFASGSPDLEHGRARIVRSGNLQEQFDQPTARPMSSEEMARCPPPTNARVGTTYACVTWDEGDLP